MPIANGITLPNPLSNGTTADAVPVMADFNALLNALNRALLDQGGTAGMNAQSTQIHNLSAGTAANDAVNLNQITNVWLPLTGGTLTGGLTGTTLSLSGNLSVTGNSVIAGSETANSFLFGSDPCLLYNSAAYAATVRAGPNGGANSQYLTLLGTSSGPALGPTTIPWKFGLISAGALTAEYARFDDGGAWFVNSTTTWGTHPKLNVGGGALGTASGNSLDIADFNFTDSNSAHIRFWANRSSNGTDWTTAETRIQSRIDVTDGPYISFNPPSLNNGFAVGTGTGGGTQRFTIDANGLWTFSNTGTIASPTLGAVALAINGSATSGAGNQQITINDPNNTNGALIKFISSGATPNKYMGASANFFVIRNNAFTNILTLDDSGNFAVSGTGTFGNEVVVNMPNSATGSGLAINGPSNSGAWSTNLLSLQDPNNSNGVNFFLKGNGATTPQKTIRVFNGNFQITNSGYTSTLFSMDDSGNIITTGFLQLGSGSALNVTGALTTGSLANSVGYLGTPQSGGAQKTTSYTLILGDMGESVDFNGASLTCTVPANSSVAYPIGTLIEITNLNASSLSIAITTDTMTLAGTTTTGTRTLAQNGVCTIKKMTATSWLIFGAGLS